MSPQSKNLLTFFSSATVGAVAVVIMSVAITVDPMQSSHRLDALKALADWSKWLISVNALLSAAGLYFGNLGGRKDERLIQWAAGFFMLSMISAGILLGALPRVMERLNDASGKSIYEYGQYCELICVPVKTLAGLEHCFFLAGIILVILRIFNQKDELW